MALAFLLMAVFALRAVRADQPIVENYVGRQIPTAMVARNLERGSGFLRPELDTGPFPNLFLVEPPIFAMLAVGFHRASGIALEPSGRLVSALAATLGAWGLFGLARRREGTAVALLAVAAFGLFPVTIRYGRAFQPDMLMIGTLLAALRCWDQARDGGRGWLGIGWLLLAVGWSLKVISVYLIVPLMVLEMPEGRDGNPHPGPLPGGEGGRKDPLSTWERAGVRVSGRRLILAALALVPAVAWYLHASAWLATGSRASAANATLWLHAISPAVWLRPETYPTILKGLAIRSFTPLGFGLAAWALVAGKIDRLWRVWAVAAGTALALMAGKLHHDYYWLALAAPAAVGVARGIVAVSESAPMGRMLAGSLALTFGCLAAWQAAPTWRTPPDWRALDLASIAIRRHVPAGVWLIAPEAVLYAADRRGCRLESGRSALRAAGEWGARLGTEGAAVEGLVSFYIARGARYIADVGDPAAGPLQGPLHQSIRHSREFQVLVDRPGLILARRGEATDGD